MALTLLNLHEPTPTYPRRTLGARPFGLKSVNLNRGIVPTRGLLYSFFVHTFGLASLLALPTLDNYRKPLPPPADQLFVIDMASKAKLVYFPTLNSPDESEAPKRKGTESKAGEAAQAKARDLRTKGLSYPGPQAIVSDPPNPTNRFQTILQPGLVDPPIIHQPVPLPNIIQIANAAPIPKPEPPKPELTVARKDLAVPSPSQAAPVPAKIALPNSAPAQPMPLPAQPATPVRKDLTVPAPTLTSSQRAKVVLPLATPQSEMPLPEKPIELTSVQKDLAIPTPAQAAALQRQNVALTNSNSASAVPVPQRPVEKELTIPTPAQAAAPQRRSAPLANTNAASAVPVPQRPVEKELTISAPTAPAPQIAAVETHGLDRQNLLALSPLPAPPTPTVRVPAGEARGRVAISPEPNTSGAGNAAGTKADTVPTTNAGVGKKPDGVAGNATSDGTGRSATAPSDKANGTGAGGATNEATGPRTGTSKSGTDSKDGGSRDGVANANGNGKSDNPAAAGNGNGNGNGNGTAGTKNPFPGITIQGGRLEGGTGVVTNSPPRSGSITLGNPPSASAPNASYGITIVSNAGSGGGLPDLGVFSHEQVYTVYVDMKSKAGAALPAWTLQYALLPATANPSGLVPPFPTVKESPEFPAELVRKYARRMVVVYAIVDAEGKLQQAAVKQTPDPELNQAALAALAKWTFRPAEVGGHPASVKILLGIPLSP